MAIEEKLVNRTFQSSEESDNASFKKLKQKMTKYKQ